MPTTNSAPLRLVLSLFLCAICATAATSTATVSADFGVSRPVTAASGLLVGSNGTLPGTNWITPISPASWRLGIYQGAQLTSAYNVALQNSQNVSFVVSDRFCYPTNNWCGALPPWQDWNRYETVVRQVAQEMIGRQVMFDVWNEPDNPDFWSGTQDQFFEAYARGYRVLRSVLGPRVLIGGPSLSKGYNKAFLTAFLDYCVRNGVEVNFLSWHELDDTDAAVAAIAGHIRDARTTLLAAPQYAALRIGRIDVNEMIGPIYNHRPGGMLAYLSQIEAGGADGASKTCWKDSQGASECLNNTLDGLLTTDSRARAGWYLYQAYADGYRTRAQASTSDSRVYALASAPAPGSSIAQILFSSINCDVFINPKAASVDLTMQVAGLDRLSAFSGITSAIVHVDRLPDTGEAASSGFAEIGRTTLPVVSGRLSLTLSGTAPGEAYRLRIEPNTTTTPSSSSFRAIVNAASAKAAVGPGSILTLLNDTLAPRTGLSVQINKVSTPFQVGTGTITTQVPDDQQPMSAPVLVSAGSYRVSGSVQTQATAPALFDMGNQVAMATNPDGTPNRAASPVLSGEAITIYFTGTGVPGSRTLKLHVGSAVVNPGSQGRMAVSPGIYSNFAQFTLPSLPPGQQPVVLEANGILSPQLYISVK